MADGLLELTIPEKPRSRDQRYRISDQGRAFLVEHGDAE
ncbi:Fic family protein [Propioniciclava flava]